MREILFRGKSGKSGEWLYGDYLAAATDGIPWILPAEFGEEIKVDPATVGQYTGLQDKNGKRIFEGDIVNIGEHNCAVNGRYLVIYDTVNHCWALKRSEEHHHHYFTFSELNGFAESSEVIGNIHDNPELLEV